ncbi:hypothetical protein QQP08_003914 [Theobroma cacao]|nr:hypothetical protein QQP08_003914 [Theobroma cacao]
MGPSEFPASEIITPVFVFVENLGREISWGSAKLEEVGFSYKCDVKMILEDSINCGLRLGECGLHFPATR